MAMKPLSKAAIGAAATGALMVSAAPAQARDRDRDGISAGEIIAGAVVIGGLAAILSGNGRDRYDSRYQNYRGDRYNDRRRGNGYNYNRYGNSRSAVNQCVRAVQNRASRYSRADVTQVTDVHRKRRGYKVKGRLIVQDGYRGRGGYYDKGKFSCVVNHGRVQNIRFSGLHH